MLIHLVLHGCFHAATARLVVVAEIVWPPEIFYSLGLCKESFQPMWLNHGEMLLSDDSQIVKEERTVAVRETHSHPISTGDGLAGMMVPFLCGVESQHSSLVQGFEILILLSHIEEL